MKTLLWIVGILLLGGVAFLLLSEKAKAAQPIQPASDGITNPEAKGLLEQVNTQIKQLNATSISSSNNQYQIDQLLAKQKEILTRLSQLENGGFA